jgi:hypothetical protein
MRSSTTDIGCTPAWTAAGPSFLTGTSLDWTHKYPPIAAALSVLPAKQAYLLLRQVAYQGLRDDKDPSEVRRPV